MFTHWYRVPKESYISFVVLLLAMWGMRWSFTKSSMTQFTFTIFLLYSAKSLGFVVGFTFSTSYQRFATSKRFYSLHFHGTNLEVPSNIRLSELGMDTTTTPLNKVQSPLIGSTGFSISTILVRSTCWSLGQIYSSNWILDIPSIKTLWHLSFLKGWSLNTWNSIRLQIHYFDTMLKFFKTWQ